ncbi:unnamed protein product [Tilletia controversa]|uniref:FAD/NAD(P)-binding domain-containing protein n=1 Tax=Tilletia controversa TaxID=13291 RepID=A0A8X7STQ2_9BASI|nr:hypothetical protein CF328_g5676 [Tilletia controversa]KAE8239959.1 hypothetical protein A4X06_0g7961 [Tilletia controversa]CAD6916631.1 unnamed protein product [Tilletia controversa]CAD6926685.1 unnamed protein product [Tilletia controversa]CAD6980013.1 unnamed protein product [Tilletia controversa]
MPALKAEPKYVHTIIIGCGVSGIATAALLKRKLGLEDVHIFERYSGAGGVWFINRYPGASCDVPVSLYSYSFAQRRNWVKAWPGRDVIQKYYESVWREYGLPAKTSFKTEVVAAKFDASTNLWHVWTRPASQPAHDVRKDSSPEAVDFDDLDSSYEHWVCKALVNAVGGLSEPNKCEVPGAENFKGPIFHSARWDTSVDMADKRVVLLGNGCSGAQIVESLTPNVKHLTQLGRSKHWYLPVHVDLDAAPLRFLRWLVPGLIRTIIFFVLESHFRAFRKVKGKTARNRTALDSAAHIRKTAPEKYHEILIPDQKTLEVGCKRRIIDQGYLKALNQPNMELRASGAKEIREHSVILDNGDEIPADVVVLATGFSIRESGGVMKIIGRDGRRDINTYLAEEYKEPSTYRGTMITGFPNMFMVMTGFNVGTGHSSIVYTAECQIDWMLRTSRDLFNERSRPSSAELVFGGEAERAGTNAVGGGGRKRFPTVEPKREAQVKEMLWFQEKMQDLVFSGACGAWYVDASSGAVAAMYPGSQVDFWRRARFPLHDDLIYRDFPEDSSSVHKPSRTWSEWIGATLKLGEVGEPKTQVGRKMVGGKIVRPGPE